MGLSRSLGERPNLVVPPWTAKPLDETALQRLRGERRMALLVQKRDRGALPMDTTEAMRVLELYRSELERHFQLQLQALRGPRRKVEALALIEEFDRLHTAIALALNALKRPE